MSINFNVKTDYSYLFTSMNSSTSNNSTYAFSGINLSDYASIKNGSYGKLLKAYYAETEGSTSDTNSLVKNAASKYSDKEEKVKKQNLNDIQSSANELGSSAAALMERGSKSVFKNKDMEEVYTAVSEFTKDYNALLDKVEDTKSSAVTKVAEKLSDVMEGYEEQLKEMGITIGEDQKLTIDKKTFVASDVDKAKELWNGSSSLSYLASIRAASVSNTAYGENNASSLYTMNGTYAAQTVGSVINGYF